MSRTIVERMALPSELSTEAVPCERLRVIIIDDSRSTMVRIRRMLAERFPDVEVTEFDPEHQGKPDPDFGWSEYDVALIDYQLGIGENGLDWLEIYRSCPGFPPTILMSDEGDEYIAERANTQRSLSRRPTHAGIFTHRQPAARNAVPRLPRQAPYYRLMAD